jgi:hypothetical protein
MKRLRFKKEFINAEHAIELIPDNFKVNDLEFELTDGKNTFKIKWVGNNVDGKGILLSTNEKALTDPDLGKSALENNVEAKEIPLDQDLQKKSISTSVFPNSKEESSTKNEKNNNQKNEPILNEVSPKSTNSLLIVGVVSSLLIISVFFYIFWIKPYLRDKNAQRLYSYVGSLVFRSSPVAGVENNSIDNIGYGSELIVYTNTGDWVNCKFNDVEGYASNKYLLSKQDFYLLNSIFGDQTSREVIGTAKCRKALLDYYKSTNIIGIIDDRIQTEVYGAIQNKDKWVIYTKPKDIKPNSVIFPRAINKTSKYTDFGCIIKNVDTGKRKFLFFTFNEFEEPTLVAEQEAPDFGDVISVKINFVNDINYLEVKYSEN